MNTLRNFLGETPRARRKALWGIALILPNTLGLLLFFGIPVIIAFITSLHDWNVFTPARFDWFNNYRDLLYDEDFWQALTNTLKLLLFTVPVEVILALGIALALNQRLRMVGIFRAMYFLPVVTSTVAASMVWTWIFQPRYGLLDSMFLTQLGFGGMKWLTRPDLVLYPIATVSVWQRVGFDMVLFLAGLQSVPQMLYEAAVIDGASRWQRFRHVTLPMLSPTTFLVIVLVIIYGFQIFDQVYIMTARTIPGGSGGSATTLTYFLYQNSIGLGEKRFGYASAVALVLFLIILSITIIQLRLQRRWVYYEAGEV